VHVITQMEGWSTMSDGDMEALLGDLFSDDEREEVCFEVPQQAVTPLMALAGILERANKNNPISPGGHHVPQDALRSYDGPSRDLTKMFACELYNIQNKKEQAGENYYKLVGKRDPVGILLQKISMLTIHQHHLVGRRRRNMGKKDSAHASGQAMVYDIIGKPLGEIAHRVALAWHEKGLVHLYRRHYGFPEGDIRMGGIPSKTQQVEHGNIRLLDLPSPTRMMSASLLYGHLQGLDSRIMRSATLSEIHQILACKTLQGMVTDDKIRESMFSAVQDDVTMWSAFQANVTLYQLANIKGYIDRRKYDYERGQ